MQGMAWSVCLGAGLVSRFGNGLKRQPVGPKHLSLEMGFKLGLMEVG